MGGVVRQMGSALARLWRWWMADIGRRSAWGKLASIGIGLFAICCLLSLALSAMRSAGEAVGVVPTRTPTLVPTATAIPTATLVSTEAPKKGSEPTALPLSPVPPTDHPAATGPSPAIREYTAKVGTSMGTMGQALKAIGQLLQKPNLTSNDWKIDLAAQMIVVQATHKSLSALTPPPEMRELHRAILDSTEDCNDAMTFMADAIDKLSASDMQHAADLMSRCTTKIQQASELIK